MTESTKRLSKNLLCAFISIVGGEMAIAATFVDLPIASAKDHAFVGDVVYFTSGAQLHAFDLATCSLLPTRTFGQALRGVDASPSGRYLAVANVGLVDGRVQVFLYDRLGGRAPRVISYPAAFGETGSFMVSWESDSTLLISGTFGGSGWTPLRRYNVETGAMVEIRAVTQNTMLASSLSHQATALAESNISSGPVHVLTSGGNVSASINTGWFMFEVATNSVATRVVAPSYSGAFVLENNGTALSEVGKIGVYANHGPLSAAFSPDDRFVVTANYGFSANPQQQGVMLYDSATLARIATIDPYPFQWAGNSSLGAGRLTLSQDGNWLAVTLNDRVRVYDVHLELGLPGIGAPCGSPTPTFEDYAEERALMERANQAVPHTVDARGWLVPLSDEAGR